MAIECKACTTGHAADRVPWQGQADGEMFLCSMGGLISQSGLQQTMELQLLTEHASRQAVLVPCAAHAVSASPMKLLSTAGTTLSCRRIWQSQDQTLCQSYTVCVGRYARQQFSM